MTDKKNLEHSEGLDITQIEEARLPVQTSKRTQRADDETARYADGEPVHIDEATNKRLFWKINRRVLGVMLVTYFCQSLDKGTLGFSSIMGIQKDANLVGQQVSRPDLFKCTDRPDFAVVQLAWNYPVHGYSCR